jgi:hypothetical protein
MLMLHPFPADRGLWRRFVTVASLVALARGWRLPEPVCLLGEIVTLAGMTIIAFSPAADRAHLRPLNHACAAFWTASHGAPIGGV